MARQRTSVFRVPNAPASVGNMAAVHLAHALGGDLMLGFVSAVAFATILAVVAGLTLSGASAVSHDIYASILCKGRVDERKEVRISKIATFMLGLVAVGLGIAFRTQNIAYLVGLVVGIAAASNFPLLVLAIYWRGLTTWGAVLGGSTGLAAPIGLTVLEPPVWVRVLGHAAPVFPLDPPTLVAMPLAFAVCAGVYGAGPQPPGRGGPGGLRRAEPPHDGRGGTRSG